MKPHETELIVEHALLNESNLILAVKVGGAYPRLKEEVIRRFLRCLQDEMRAALGVDWNVEIEMDEKSSPYLYIRRLAWPEDIDFGIGSDNGCLAWVYVWVTRCGETLGNALLDDTLKQSLEELFGPWKSSSEFSFFWRILDKYRHWGEDDTLVEIYHARQALEYVKALLLKIHRTVTPIIDGSLPSARTGKA